MYNTPHVTHTSAVRKVSSHYECPGNQSYGLDVNWQPGRGNLTVHPWTVTLPGVSQSAVRCRWLSLCTVWPSHSQWPSQQISFITTMRLPILQLSCSLFLAKHHITPGCQLPYSSGLSPCDFWFFQKLKSPLKRRRFVNATVIQYTSPFNGVLLPTD